jgi:hypothetical protein
VLGNVETTAEEQRTDLFAQKQKESKPTTKVKGSTVDQKPQGKIEPFPNPIREERTPLEEARGHKAILIKVSGGLAQQPEGVILPPTPESDLFELPKGAAPPAKPTQQAEQTNKQNPPSAPPKPAKPPPPGTVLPTGLTPTCKVPDIEYDVETVKSIFPDRGYDACPNADLSRVKLVDKTIQLETDGCATVQYAEWDESTNLNKLAWQPFKEGLSQLTSKENVAVMCNTPSRQTKHYMFTNNYRQAPVVINTKKHGKETGLGKLLYHQ